MSDQSPRAIEAEIEQTRERLGQALDELLYRAKPSTIAARETSKVKVHFVDPETGATRTDNIVKVAAGVAGAVALVVLLRRLTK